MSTGIQELKIVDVPIEIAQAKIPEEVYNKIVTNLEKENARVKKGRKNASSVNCCSSL